MSQDFQERFAWLLDERDTPETLWRPQELGAILTHQLDAPLSFPEAHTAGFPTFARLLLGTAPPAELLRRTAEWGKQAKNNPEVGLPAEVGAMLYTAALAAGVARLGQILSRMDESSLREGFRWALRQPWLDERLRPLFLSALGAE